MQIHWHFNPRSREGSDTEHRYRRNRYCISIHAPARGATTAVRRYRYTTGNFNPRSREGSDQTATGVDAEQQHFNPRSREGSDANGAYKTAGMSAFQSTLPRGERQYQLIGTFATRIISIHAPARGATYSIKNTVNTSQFQSTLPRGERHGSTGSSKQRGRISIHAPARGATSQFFSVFSIHTISIHAPARGATLTDWLTAYRLIFQSTLPRGERPHQTHSSR